MFIQSASAHSAGPVYGFVALWYVGVFVCGFATKFFVKKTPAKIDSKFYVVLAKISQERPKCSQNGAKRTQHGANKGQNGAKRAQH